MRKLQRNVARTLFVFLAGVIGLTIGCSGSSGMVDSGMADSAMVGYPAPAIDLSNLDGTGVSLADHVGSEIVILDFWATWCGPCEQAMPTIIAVAEKYASEGVVLYAVNIREDSATIRDFLERTGMQVDVLLDLDASVATAYGANSIPQTVIIDKDGTVQAIHVGLTSGLGAELSSQLEALISGRKLAAGAAPRGEAAM